MLARIGVHPPAKVSRQLAQSLFCQRCVGKELVPPGQQPSAGLPQRMIPAHRNAISAVVGALKSIGQVARQVVCSCHVLRLSKPAVRRQANLFFPALSGKKCVLLLNLLVTPAAYSMFEDAAKLLGWQRLARNGRVLALGHRLVSLWNSK